MSREPSASSVASSASPSIYDHLTLLSVVRHAIHDDVTSRFDVDVAITISANARREARPIVGQLPRRRGVVGRSAWLSCLSSPPNYDVFSHETHQNTKNCVFLSISSTMDLLRPRGSRRTTRREHGYRSLLMTIAALGLRLKNWFHAARVLAATRRPHCARRATMI